MRTILQTALAVGFVAAIALGAPAVVKAQELCIGICVFDPNGSADRDRAWRYPEYRDNRFGRDDRWTRDHSSEPEREYDFGRNRRYFRDAGYNRDYRYNRDYGYYRDYDVYANHDSYESYVAYQRWTYYRYYYDKGLGGPTQYKIYNKGYDVR